MLHTRCNNYEEDLYSDDSEVDRVLKRAKEARAASANKIERYTPVKLATQITP
jgi:hypothetical protein